MREIYSVMYVVILYVGLCAAFQELRTFLRIQKKMLSMEISDEDNTLYKMMRSTIQTFIKKALQTEPFEDIRQQMQYLCQSFDIPTKLSDWAKKEVDTINEDLVRSDIAVSQDVLITQNDEPLFNKDILYHASLCCQAVSSYDSSSYDRFFSTKPHGLKEISMSICRSSVDRYIIAKQDKDIIYMAFQSEPNLSKWIDIYRSVTEGKHLSFSLQGIIILYIKGLDQQMNRIPLKFLEELLGNQSKVVFTGINVLQYSIILMLVIHRPH